MKLKLLFITLFVYCAYCSTISAQAINDTLIKPYKNYVITQRDIDIAKRADKIDLSVPKYLNSRTFKKKHKGIIFDTTKILDLSNYGDISLPGIIIEYEDYFHDKFATKSELSSVKIRSKMPKDCEFYADLNKISANYLSKFSNNQVHYTDDALNFIKYKADTGTVNFTDQIWELDIDHNSVNVPTAEAFGLSYALTLSFGTVFGITSLTGLLGSSSKTIGNFALASLITSPFLLITANTFNRNNNRTYGRNIAYNLTVYDINKSKMAQYQTVVYYECNKKTEKYYRHNYSATAIPALRGLIGQYLNDTNMVKQLRNNQEFLSLMGSISDDPEFNTFLNYQIE